MAGGRIRAVREHFAEVIDSFNTWEDWAMVVGELQHIANLAQHALRTAALAEHHDGGWAADGFLSSKRWLCHHTALSPSAAGTLLNQGMHFTAMPHSAKASAAGVLSETRLRLLVSCHSADPELYDDQADRVFNEIHNDRDLAVAARQWIDAAKDRNGKPPRNTEFGLWLSETLDGTWKLDATLAPGDGKLLDEAIQQHLRPMLAARRDGDPSVERLSVADLKAQALVDIADRDTAANRCDIHHRIHWQHGGTTSIDTALPTTPPVHPHQPLARRP